MCMGLASRFFYTLSTQLIIPNYLYIWWSNEINLSCIRKVGCNQQTSTLKARINLCSGSLGCHATLFGPKLTTVVTLGVTSRDFAASSCEGDRNVYADISGSCFNSSMTTAYTWSGDRVRKQLCDQRTSPRRDIGHISGCIIASLRASSHWPWGFLRTL